MKKVLSIIAVAVVATFVACGPSAEEKAKMHLSLSLCKMLSQLQIQLLLLQLLKLQLLNLTKVTDTKNLCLVS
jgi:hypothetical protein